MRNLLTHKEARGGSGTLYDITVGLLKYFFMIIIILKQTRAEVQFIQVAGGLVSQTDSESRRCLPTRFGCESV